MHDDAVRGSLACIDQRQYWDDDESPADTKQTSNKTGRSTQ
jgi:hypothetical protein